MRYLDLDSRLAGMTGLCRPLGVFCYTGKYKGAIYMMMWIIIGIVVLIVIVLAAMYNGLVRLNQQASEAWSDITVQLKRRYDLIPNLVNTVKGYATHEKTVFEDVTKARANALNAQGVAQTAQAENQFSQALKSLFAVA